VAEPSARFTSALVALAVTLAPAVALACPYCAGRDDGGLARGVALGVFVLFPFAVVAAVVRFIKRADPGATRREAE
jgi:hypothetical protein